MNTVVFVNITLCLVTGVFSVVGILVIDNCSAHDVKEITKNSSTPNVEGYKEEYSYSHVEGVTEGITENSSTPNVEGYKEEYSYMHVEGVAEGITENSSTPNVEGYKEEYSYSQVERVTELTSARHIDGVTESSFNESTSTNTSSETTTKTPDRGILNIFSSSNKCEDNKIFVNGKCRKLH